MSETGPSTRSQAQRVSLLRTWPEIAWAIPAEQRLLAERALHAPVLTERGADLGLAMASYGDAAFSFLIVKGAVLKETFFQSRSALELLCAGDLLAPVLTPERQTFARATSEYRAHGQASIAVLEGRFENIAQRWPSVSAFLHCRLAEQSHRASLHLAMLHLPRAEDRILALFADFAERFGRMTPQGVVIELELTHDLIGHFVGSRRPTVSLALLELDRSGQLVRRDDGRWAMPAK